MRFVHREVEGKPKDKLKRVYEFELDHNSCGCTLGIHIDHPGLYATFCDDGFHLPGNVVEAIVGGGADLDGSLHFLGSAFMIKVSNLLTKLAVIPP